MVLIEQISALLDYLEGQPELALGHCSRTNEGRSMAKRRWVECAKILNSTGANCPKKSPNEWRTFYNEYKCKVFKKIKLQNREMKATGHAKKIKLTPLQERLYDIIGRDIGEPLAVEVEPIARASTANNSFSLDQEPMLFGEQSPNNQRPSQEPRQCRLRQFYPAEDRDHSILDAAQARLEQIKVKNAEATLAHAQATENLAAAIDKMGTATNEATNRLAAAIEKIGDMISLFVASPSNKKRCKIIIVSSDSESD